MAHEDLHFTTGDVHGHALQARDIHGDVYLNGIPPASAPCAPPPSCWADAPEPPPEVQALLRAQVNAAHELPYQLPGARKPSLDTVYVRQNLGSSIEESEQQRPIHQTSDADDHGHLLDMPTPPTVRITVRPPSRPMRAALDSDAHLLVTGGPGQGKSTLSLRLAADIAEYWTSRNGEPPLAEPVVPLRITARSLAARRDLPFAQALAESVNADYGPLLREPVLAQSLKYRACGCRWLLIVDALDEVADTAHRNRLVNALAAWASDTTYRVLLTTRPIEGGALAPLHRIGAVRYELQPFDEAGLKRFAANWFPPDDAHRFLQQIREAHLDELVQVPLLATIAAIIFDEYRSDPLPGNQYSLYETYFAHIRSGTSSAFDAHRVPLLEHLARTRLERDTSLLAAARRWVADHLSPDSPTWTDDLTAYLVAVGPFTLRNGDLTFLHHSFAEHLAATSIARDLPAEFDPDAFAVTLHAARPREAGRFARRVLLHHARLHPGQADHLLRWLHAGDSAQHLLAARLLGHQLPASPEAVESFLGTVWSWAMTTQYIAGEILPRATRATHHPGLAQWLIRLMRAEDAPLRSRAEAATALAVRVRGPVVCESIAFLHRVVDDVEASVQDRLIAAEALAQCGSNERAAAEQALRAVLVDPHATGEMRRVAAVVLAAFDDDSRTFATGALLRLMSDVDTRPADLAEIATGLLEISVEFQAQSADAFLRVLSSPVDVSGNGMRTAAVGLASLGADRLAEAVTVLTAVITERSRSINHRGDAALALAELSTQHRRTAGNLLVTELAESTALPLVRAALAVKLAQLGSTFRDEALTHLNVLLGSPALREHERQLAAGSMVDLEPALRDRVAQNLAEFGVPGQHSRLTVLERLEKFGEPHRSRALAELREVVANREAHFEVRCRAASDLIMAAPELHEYAIDRLLVLAREHNDPVAEGAAWCELVVTRLREQALAELFSLYRHGRRAGVVLRLGPVASSTHAESIALARESLVATFHDPSQPMRERLTAIFGLAPLSRAFDRLFADLLADLVRSGDVTISDFSYVARFLRNLGPGPIEVFAAAVRAVLNDPRTTSARAWNAVQAMEELGCGADPEVLRAAGALAADQCLDVAVRAHAAVTITRKDSSAQPMAADRVVAASGKLMRVDVRTAVRDLGPALVSRYRAVLSDPDARGAQRCSAAVALLDAVELRRHVADDHLAIGHQMVALHSLVSVDQTEHAGAVERFAAVLHDCDLPVAERTRAARELALVDRRLAAEVITQLQRLVEDPHLPAGDRAVAVRRLQPMLVLHTDWFVQAATAIVRDPTISHRATRELSTFLPRSLRTEVEQVLLEDRSAEIALRVPKQDLWDDLPLRNEAVAAMRDAVVAPETSGRDRVDAAAALAELSWPLVPEAITLLERIGTARARLELARLGKRQQVYDEAMAVVVDSSQPFRQRHAAALLVEQISDEPAGEVLDVLLDAPSWQHRIKVWTVVEDLTSLRAMRDDPRETAWARHKAALALVDRRVEDRAAAARVFEELALDSEVKPQMRAQAAEDLGKLGVRGRQRALDVLQHLAEEDGLPVTVRARAAAKWYGLKPTAKQKAFVAINGLAPGKPLQRVRVLAELGKFDSPLAVRELQRMAARATDPVVRMRCARAMVDLRRDQREKAAVVAREVAWDERVPGHVRRNAARDLARWSDLMREDARTLIRSVEID